MIIWNVYLIQEEVAVLHKAMGQNVTVKAQIRFADVMGSVILIVVETMITVLVMTPAMYIGHVAVIQLAMLSLVGLATAIPLEIRKG